MGQYLARHVHIYMYKIRKKKKKIYMKYKHTHTYEVCNHTYVDPRACLYLSHAKNLFSAFKRRRVRVEKCWNVGMTCAYVWEYLYVRAGTRTRPASYVFIAVETRVYARRARFAFSSYFLLAFSPFLLFLPFRFSFFAHIPRGLSLLRIF